MPAAEIEDTIARYVGRFPATFPELERALARHNYEVHVVDRGTEPHCNVTRRAIFIPRCRPERMLRMLYHEAAEAFTRLPVAPEFCYEPSGEDEHHNVACVAEQRFADSLAEERERLSAAETESEEIVACLETELKRRAGEYEGAALALKQLRLDDYREPNHEALAKALTEHAAEVRKLGQIRRRLAGLG